ncbi:hypothetical protein NMY22_g4166 [Coprinellus aureogranulatus]|nr:hypothetical protein NMY22_g4166 [Coprinellus aureogranulatus]
MPALTPNSNAKVLITGATGFVGQWVLRTLLDRGYTARVVVRSESKNKTLQKIFEEDANKLEFVVIEDMSKEGAFDEAIAGVDAVAHVATPIPGEATPEETLRIAQDATVGVLKSALKESGKSVKRIVITSTFATVLTVQDEPRTYTEDDRTQQPFEKWDAGHRDFQTVYPKSKILAERAVEEFLEKHKDEVKFDVTLLNPPFVFGPTYQRVSSVSEFQSTSKFWFESILQKRLEPPMPEANQNPWIDVRDLGEAHARALERSEATGYNRILVSEGSFVWQEWQESSWSRFKQWGFRS